MLADVTRSYIRLMMMPLIFFLVFGCSSERENLVGNYTAVDQASADPVTADLELLPDGKGFWSIETDNAAFRWDLHRGKIRLHTKSGGVIEGILDHDTIQLTLPGMGLIRFQRLP
ncbi:hypothetical protein [Desulfobacula sp.]|uniref:hypothetical protein n=1 Tax=Desulfobacula sp. TaxID=2593537 RepID=UPI00260996AC|nr:hypothetical protein [Desulfobacula sp.]